MRLVGWCVLKVGHGQSGELRWGEVRWLHGRSGQALSWTWTPRGGRWLQSERSWCFLWRSAVWSAPWLKWTSRSQSSRRCRFRYLWKRVWNICKNIGQPSESLIQIISIPFLKKEQINPQWCQNHFSQTRIKTSSFCVPTNSIWFDRTEMLG